MHSSFAASDLDALTNIESTLVVKSANISTDVHSYFIGDDTQPWFDGARIKESIESGVVSIPKELKSAEDIEEWLMSL